MATVNRLRFAFGAFLAGTLALSSCAQKSDAPQPMTSGRSETTAADRSDIASPSQVAHAIPSVTPAAAPTPTVTVKIYQADSQCAAFVPQAVKVSKARSMEAAIGKVIAAQRNADFDLAGYRVKQGANGGVTIDLRVAPDSKRQIVSLSSCEQFALLGSIRETLIRNPQWRVKSVRFTDRGRNIVL